jgi:aminopeptidase
MDMISIDNHAARLDRLADVAVKVGLRLAPGQQLIMTAPLDAVPLARRITEHAYRAGASLVTTMYSDEEATLARFRYAPDSAFDTAPGWLFDGMATAFAGGAARLAIAGEDPNLLAGQSPDRLARANDSRSRAYRPALAQIAGFATNWTIASYATPSWARTVFPDLVESEAVSRLWDAIFAASRVDAPDPAAAWAEHNANLGARCAKLTAAHFSALHFRGPGTDLRVGLADGHAWVGGATQAKNGIICNPNIPSEEVFTTPHRLRVDGTVSSTKPLSYQGTLLRDIRVTFAAGRIVDAYARVGQEVLSRVLETDEGAARLGEVALVPHASPISASGLLFYNTLFDENAASHIALGQAYDKCFGDWQTIEEEGFIARGANRSRIHIDWMIGSAEVDVDGLDESGRATPVMRNGAWV